jgi:Mobilization protein NikA
MRNNENKRGTTITARVTQAEREMLTRRAAGRSLSDYIRAMLLGRRSRALLQPSERVALVKLGEVGDDVGAFTQHVATHESLKRGDVIEFLRRVEGDLDALRLAIIRGGADDGTS